MSTLSNRLVPATEPTPRSTLVGEKGSEQFGSRTSFLTGLRELLHKTGRVALLAPESGDREGWDLGWGRTSLCRRLAEDHAYETVLSLSAADELQFRYSIWKVAGELDLPEAALRRGHDVVAGTRDWLQTHSNWLLIVDRLSSVELVAPLLGGVNGGHVVLLPEGAGSAAHSGWTPIAIPRLPASEAARLLSLGSGREINVVDAASLSTQLCGNPLALELAGSLLRRGVTPLPPMLPTERDGEESPPVAQVVRQAVEHLRESSPGAADLLATLVHLSSGPIDERQIGLDSAAPMTDCWNTLREIGLLRAESRCGRVVSVPTAVRDACLRWMSLDSGPSSRKLQLAIDLIPDAPARTPLADFAFGRDAAPVDDWACHRSAVADHVVRNGVRTDAERRLLRDSACDALVLGAFARSISQFELLRESTPHELRESPSGEPTRNPGPVDDVAGAIEDNAAALIAAQRYLEARRMLRQAAELGTPAPRRITSILLATIELNLYENRLERAASRLPAAREWCDRLPVEDRVDGAARLAFLAAATALAQGRLPDAESHLAECRQLREAGGQMADHPEMLRLRRLEARVAFLLKDFARSERVLRDDLRILAESRTTSVAQRAASLSLLADLLFRTERADEALAVHGELLAVRRRLHEAGHPLIIEAANRLAILLGRRGRAGEAEALFAESISATTEVVGTSHPELARVLNDFAEFLHSRGRYEQAESHLRTALGIQERSLRASDPRIVRTRNNLAAVHVGRGQFAAAERLYREDILLKRHGAEGRTSLATALNNLGETLRRQGKWGEAESAFQEALDIRIAELGETHPHVAQSRSNLANLYLASGNLPKARSEAERALSLRRTTFEASHPLIGVSLNLLAEIAIRETRYRDAQAPLLEACDIFAATPGSPYLGGALLAAGLNAIRLRKRGRGELLLRRAVDVLSRTHGPKNPVHARALVALAELQIADREGDGARALLESAMPALREANAPAEIRRELGEALLRLGTILSPDQACRMIGLALPFLSESPVGTSEAPGTDISVGRSVPRQVDLTPSGHETAPLVEAKPTESIAAGVRVTDPDQALCGSVFDDF